MSVSPTGGSRYVYSSWSDSDLKAWAVKHGLVKSDAQTTRDQLLDAIKTPYNDASDHIYDTWSDSYLVSLERRAG